MRGLEPCRQIALKLDFELPLFRSQDDRIYEHTQGFSSSGAALFVFEGARQLRHFLPVKIRLSRWHSPPFGGDTPREWITGIAVFAPLRCSLRTLALALWASWRRFVVSAASDSR